MTNDDLAQMIAVGHETQRVEFKPPGRRDDGHTMAVVARAVMAMANLRGGGVVILGVAERPDKTLDPVGLTPEMEGTWSNHDALCDQLARYAEPSVVFDTEVRTFDGRRFVAITVEEFAEVPILCRQGHTSAPDPSRNRLGPSEVLKPAALYVRAKHKPESAPVATSEDMREVINLAVEKGIARQEQLEEIRRQARSKSRAESLYEDELRGLE